MVQIIGRLTRDSEVKHLDETKTVVNFTIALNDYYKTKEGEAKEIVEFIQCSYWGNIAVAKSLKKGAVVEAGGRLYASAYLKGDEPKGQINLMAQYIKVHVFAKEEEGQQPTGTQEESTKGKRGGWGSNKPRPGITTSIETVETPVADLPF